MASPTRGLDRPIVATDNFFALSATHISGAACEQAPASDGTGFGVARRLAEGTYLYAGCRSVGQPIGSVSGLVSIAGPLMCPASALGSPAGGPASCVTMLGHIGSQVHLQGLQNRLLSL